MAAQESSLAASYARFDALNAELEAAPSSQVDWPLVDRDKIYLSDADRVLEGRQLDLCPLPPFGSVVSVDGLTGTTKFNGAIGVVVSAPLCGGTRVAVELRTKAAGRRLVARGINLTACFLEPAPRGDALFAGRAGRVDLPSGSRGALWIGDCAAAALLAGQALERMAAEGARATLDALVWPTAVTAVVRVAAELHGGPPGTGGPTAADGDGSSDPAAAAATACELLDAGETVLVCGVEGKNRAAAVALLCLTRRGATLAAAWAAVRKARPAARLTAPVALAVAAATEESAEARAALAKICPRVDAAALDAALAAVVIEYPADGATLKL